jgi:hypothetical protein
VVRGGYGWFFWQNNGYTDGGDTVWNVLPVNYTYNLSLASLADASLQNPFPNVPALPTFVPRTVSSQISDSNMAETVKDAMVQQWSLNIQYQVLPATTLEIGYVGARGAHLPDQDPTNQPLLASAASPVNCGLPNTAAGLGNRRGRLRDNDCRCQRAVSGASRGLRSYGTESNRFRAELLV